MTPTTGPKSSFVLFDGEVTHPGDKRLHEDWDFHLGMDVEPGVPANWLKPINFAEGTYYVRWNILEMTPVDKPVFFGFGWTNRPRGEDPTIQHRANKPIAINRSDFRVDMLNEVSVAMKVVAE